MPRKRLTTEEIKERIEELTNGEYLLLGNYLGANTKMLIKHNVCKNEYEARWGNFQQGYRCPKCSGLDKLNNDFEPTEEILEQPEIKKSLPAQTLDEAFGEPEKLEE